MLGTDDDIIVEASPVDFIWGIGLSQDVNDAYNPLKWKGQNLLGFALMAVKDNLNDFKSKLISAKHKEIRHLFIADYEANKNKNIKMENNLKSTSKFLSLVLRHKPEEIGLQLDENGWAVVDDLIKKVNAKGNKIDIDLFNEIVETNDKKRFAFNEDKSKIRASQGHSIEIDLAIQAVMPPDVLYHGTATRFVDSILRSGLTKQQRQHVHLSEKLETATAIGARHGIPTILIVNAKQMQEDGFLFYKSENNVWLTDIVAVKYIKF